jgi:hypothetical protein
MVPHEGPFFRTFLKEIGATVGRPKKNGPPQGTVFHSSGGSLPSNPRR